MKVHRVFGIFCALAVVAGGSGCSIDPNSVPMPGTGVEDGYELTIEFASALNLPDRANVTMDGLRIGEVGEVRLFGDVVEVVATIDGGTRIPSDVTAIIRQNTLLGDTYVALDRDKSKTPDTFLEAGGVIDRARTTSPPQVEDVMAILANFINGGNVQNVQGAIIRVNNVMPDHRDLERLAQTVSVDLKDLGDSTAKIDVLIDGLNATATSVNDNDVELQAMFGDSAVRYWKRLNEGILQYVGTLLPSIGSIFEGGLWLVPLFTSLADTATSVRSTGEDVPADIQAVSVFLDGTLLPFLRNPAVNVEAVETTAGTNLTADIYNVLRMLGAVR